MLNNRDKLLFFRQISDYFILILSFSLALLLTFQKIHFQLSYFDGFLLLFQLILWFFVSKAFEIYDEYRSRSFFYELVAILKSMIIFTIFMIIILFIAGSKVHSRYFVAVDSLLLFSLLISSKILIRQVVVMLRKSGRNIRHMLIIGTGVVGQQFQKLINSNLSFGYNIIGFLDDDESFTDNKKYLGKIADLNAVLLKHQIDDIIIALPSQSTDLIEDIVNTCNAFTTRIRIIPDYFKFLSHKYSISMFGNFPIISVKNIHLDQIHWRLLKRAFDYVFTFFAFLFIFSWVWPIIAIAIKISSKGPVFFKQVRHGRDNRPFKAYKFRSMLTDSIEIDANGKYLQARKDDPRITKIGAFLRKTNLDELPQFINVLRGEMSIVGPRPHPIKLNEESRNHVSAYMQRHFVKPGITGWAQANGYRGETKEEGLMQKRIDHDIWYIENWSFLLDIQIIFMTVWSMIKGDENAY